MQMNFGNLLLGSFAILCLMLSLVGLLICIGHCVRLFRKEIGSIDVPFIVGAAMFLFGMAAAASLLATLLVLNGPSVETANKTMVIFDHGNPHYVNPDIYLVALKIDEWGTKGAFVCFAAYAIQNYLAKKRKVSRE